MDNLETQRALISALVEILHASRLWRIVLALLLGIVLCLALTPTPPQQVDFGGDKLNHLLAFAVLTVVGTLGFPGVRARLAAGLLAFGVLIEMLQSLTPGRSAEWADLGADAVGMALGSVLAFGIARVARRLKPLK